VGILKLFLYSVLTIVAVGFIIEVVTWCRRKHWEYQFRKEMRRQNEDNGKRSIV
jgi:hypothetical protein